MIVRAILDRFVLVAATILAGGMSGFPGHVLQRMAGRLDQATETLRLFERTAELEHEGSLEALIAHFHASSDASVRAQGDAIARLVDDQVRLERIHDALAAGTWEQGLLMLSIVDRVDLVAALEHYRPALVFTLDGLVFATVIGVGIWLTFMGAWHGCARLLRRR